MRTPTPRVTRMSLYSRGGETATYLGQTWVEPEAFTYPHGGFSRYAFVRIVDNPHNPLPDLPLGEYRRVKVSCPDTYSTIPARLRVKGKTIKGYISVRALEEEFTFTPEANPEHCTMCLGGDGCKRGSE